MSHNHQTPPPNNSSTPQTTSSSSSQPQIIPQDRLEVRRKMQLAMEQQKYPVYWRERLQRKQQQQDNNDDNIHHHHQDSEENQHLPYGSGSNKNAQLSNRHYQRYTHQQHQHQHTNPPLPHEITQSSQYIQQFSQIDPEGIAPKKTKRFSFTSWERFPFSVFFLSLSCGAFGAMLFCGAQQYSTHVLTKLAQLNSFSRVLVLGGLVIDSYYVWNYEENPSELSDRYLNAMRIQQRDYYEKKWGLPENLRQAMGEDSFWKRVAETRSENGMETSSSVVEEVL